MNRLALRIACRFAIAAAVSAPVAAAAETVVRWQLGSVDGEPVLRRRIVETALADGRWQTQVDEEFRAGRRATLRALRRETTVEAEDGALVSIEIESGDSIVTLLASPTGCLDWTEAARGDDDGGSIVRSSGTVESPGGQPLRGPRGERQVVLEALSAGCDAVEIPTLVFERGAVKLRTVRRDLAARDGDGRSVWRERSSSGAREAMITYDADGRLDAAEYPFAGRTLRVEASSAVPPRLGGTDGFGELSLAAAGKPPLASGTPVSYRLPAALRELVPERDAFQRRVGNDLVVDGRSLPAEIGDAAPFLAAEELLETGDDELCDWVRRALPDRITAATAIVPRLREAVSQRIATRASGYGGSALDAFRERRGSCLEAARLLTAALRIAGVSARVEVGLLYQRRSGRWIAHAWTSSYDATRAIWLHADASEPWAPRTSYIKVCDGSNARREAIERSLVRFLEAAGAGGAIELVGEPSTENPR